MQRFPKSACFFTLPRCIKCYSRIATGEYSANIFGKTMIFLLDLSKLELMILSLDSKGGLRSISRIRQPTIIWPRQQWGVDLLSWLIRCWVLCSSSSWLGSSMCRVSSITGSLHSVVKCVKMITSQCSIVTDHFCFLETQARLFLDSKTFWSAYVNISIKY